MSVPSVPESPLFSVIRGGPSSLRMVSVALTGPPVALSSPGASATVRVAVSSASYTASRLIVTGLHCGAMCAGFSGG